MTKFTTLLSSVSTVSLIIAPMAYDAPCSKPQGDKILENKQSMEQFLADIERRAYRMAEIGTGNREDALDLVQEAMIGLVQKYAHKPEAEWGPLFHRILQSRIRDWYRRNTVRNKVKGWLKFTSSDDAEQQDPIQTAPDTHGKDPESSARNHDAGEAINLALKQLPLRQQQAFLLRSWEGLSVNETAKAMACSEGSVKTHYSRAVHNLRTTLEDHYP
jgi:RNA polymerase sigma-70 factor, ECF subfamily